MTDPLIDASVQLVLIAFGIGVLVLLVVTIAKNWTKGK